jgi:HEAT repeat protein
MTPIANAVNTLATRPPGSPLPVDEAMSLLGFVGHTLMPVLPQLAPAATRPELREVLERLAQATAAALEQLRPGQAPVATLVDTLKAGDAPSRLSAAQALAERGPESEEAAGVLLQAALNDADPVVRLQAAVALFRIDGRVQVVLPLLVRALSDPSDAVCWYAADCLRQIGPPAKEAAAAVREALGRQGRVALVRRSLELALAALER